MTDADDHFKRLEEKVYKAAELFRHAQEEKRTLHQEVEKLKADAKERARRYDAMEHELTALRKEREEVRNRVERLLQQIDTLTKPESEG